MVLFHLAAFAALNLITVFKEKYLQSVLEN